MAPSPFKVGPVCVEISGLRYGNALELAFLAQDIKHHGGRRACLGVAEKIDYIVEIARPCPFGQRPHFLTECLFIRIGENLNAAIGFIAVGMEDRSAHGRKDKALVSGQVEFYAWQSA